MTGWELIEGIWLEEAIERRFADPRARYLHVSFRRARLLRGQGGTGVSGAPCP